MTTGGETHTAPQSSRRLAGRTHRRNRIRSSDDFWEIAARVRSSAAGEEYHASNAASRGIEPIGHWTSKIQSVRKLANEACCPYSGVYADVAFWAFLIDRARGSAGESLGVSLHSFNLQLHKLVSDAPSTAMDGYCSESGRRWQMDLEGEVQERQRVHKRDHKDLSINGLELLSMVITAWAFFGPAGTRPHYGGGNSMVPKRGQHVDHLLEYSVRGARSLDRGR